MNVQLDEQDKIKVLNSDDLYGIMQKVLLRENKIDQDREHFWIVGLSHQNKILFVELISKGSVNKLMVEPMDVFGLALSKRASHIILVHNHPSGELIPSPEDKDMTDRFIQIGIIVGTPVFDHLIIAEKSYMSFANTGIMDELRMSEKYVPGPTKVDKIKAEAEHFAKEQEKFRIAANLKKAGVDIKTIESATGLDPEELESFFEGK